MLLPAAYLTGLLHTSPSVLPSPSRSITAQQHTANTTWSLSQSAPLPHSLHPSTVTPHSIPLLTSHVPGAVSFGLRVIHTLASSLPAPSCIALLSSVSIP